ncbi:hypothetical protein ABIH81_06720 [Micromonospora sp. HUAS YX12]|uniref:Uncharacterized protein n=1 Tax=Micromonospora sp. HUAS YX12 TaxID=3156396 RepID=A0AAU7R437_9ACTN
MNNVKRRNRALLTVAALIAATVGASIFLQPAAHGEKPSSLRDQVLRHEQLVADCMKSRGFDYSVGVPRDLIVEEARAAAEAKGGDVKAAVIEATEASRNHASDPNELIVAQLSPERQRAWGDALWGTDESSGCFDSTLQAAARVDLDAGLERAEAIFAQAKSDPSVQAAENDYLACMAAHRHQIRSIDSFYEYVGLQAEKLSTEAGQELSDAAYAHHADCSKPYNERFNDVHRKLLGGK